MADLHGRAEIEAEKQRKFHALVRHAKANSPYYAKLIQERSIDVDSCRPADFPLLTKTTLMANFDEIVTDRRLSKKAVAEFLTRSTDPKEMLFGDITVMHTSGTSGEVGYFLYARADYARMRSAARRNFAAYRGRFPFPWLKGRRIRIAFYGATGGHFAGVTGVASMQRGLARLLLKAEAFEINQPLGVVAAGLNAFQPDVLFGYTTALKMLGDEQRAGRLTIIPAAVAATGETATKADLQFLSAAFGDARALSLYACTEHMMLGISNPGGETMTLLDDNLVFEFHEDHSLITNLFNYTLPMIRYRMSDILRVTSASDARHIVIDNLVGRAEQMPVFVNGAGIRDFISPHIINEIFVDGVTRFQMQITGPDSFRFPVCIDPALDGAGRTLALSGVTARLRAILEQKGLANVRFEVAAVDDIPLNERTRKFQLIVDRT
jgi:phenylacetate-coenzyme A ligase PaaK-like adenylate-forming protein